MYSDILISESMEGIEEVTLKSLLRRPSVLKGFEDIREVGTPIHTGPDNWRRKDELQRICNQA